MSFRKLACAEVQSKLSDGECLGKYTCQQRGVNYQHREDDQLVAGVAAWQACLHLCRASRACNLWVWVENPRSPYAHHCNLLSAGVAHEDPNVVSGPRECGEYRCKEEGVTYGTMPEHVVVHEVASWRACLAHCDAAPLAGRRCSHWVWGRGAGGAGGACHLMYHPGEPG